MSVTPTVQLATSNEEIVACHPVMHELRPHIDEQDFVSRVRAQAQVNAFQLAYVRDQDLIVAVAGFRIGYNLAWGHYLYVDDLVTRATHRSQGFGAFHFVGCTTSHTKPAVNKCILTQECNAKARINSTNETVWQTLRCISTA